MTSSNGQPQTTHQQNQQAPPLEQVMRSLAKDVGMLLAPRVIALEDFRLSAASYRNRIFDAHRMGMKALGVPDEYITEQAKASDMGDLIIGDTIQNFPQAPANAIPVEPITPPKPPVVQPPVVAPPVVAPPIVTNPPAPVATDPTPAVTPAPASRWLWPALAVAAGTGLLGTGLALGTLFHKPDTSNVTVQPSSPDVNVTVPGTPTQPVPGRADYKMNATVSKPDKVVP